MSAVTTDKLDSLVKELLLDLYGYMKNVPKKDATSVRVSFAFFLGTRIEELYADKEDRSALAAVLEYLSRADDQQIMDIVKGAEASATGNS